MKGKESKKESKKEKATTPKAKVLTEYQREKKRKNETTLDIKSK
ncbi:hypothetical protein [uncultured Bacteroides sp.]|nr:hypothetical protein [uncultured Bacteroides sp.]